MNFTLINGEIQAAQNVVNGNVVVCHWTSVEIVDSQ
jgi:hypothetical protein